MCAPNRLTAVRKSRLDDDSCARYNSGLRGYECTADNCYYNYYGLLLLLYRRAYIVLLKTRRDPDTAESSRQDLMHPQRSPADARAFNVPSCFVIIIIIIFLYLVRPYPTLPGRPARTRVLAAIKNDNNDLTYARGYDVPHTPVYGGRWSPHCAVGGARRT